jgi:hypothetical protein
MARHTPPEPCSQCGALMGDPARHAAWHAALLAELSGVPQPAGRLDDDDRPTAKLPPIRETVLRRPPAAVRELKGPELLRALADELDREGLSVEDLDR